MTPPDDADWSGRLLVDGFGRIRDSVHTVVDDLDVDQLSWRPEGSGNPIGWLVWHLTRIQDDHLADAVSDEQVWSGQGWAERFALPFEVGATGYGHSSADVDAVRAGLFRAGTDALRGYHDAVHGTTVRLLGSFDDKAFGRVVDERWDPPVTLAVRLVSVLADNLKHSGQAEYVRGLLPEA